MTSADLDALLARADRYDGDDEQHILIRALAATLRAERAANDDLQSDLASAEARLEEVARQTCERPGWRVR